MRTGTLEEERIEKPSEEYGKEKTNSG